MIDTLSALLSAGAVPQTSYAPDSRYFGLAPSTYITADGRTIQYTSRRFIPQPESFAPIAVHTVAQGERVDVMAQQFFGDPYLYWRLCDANLAVRPDDLERAGLVLRVTLAAAFASRAS
jgi:hypothetical protein